VNRLAALIGVAALAVTAVAPQGAAADDPPATTGEAGSKSVIPSPTGSYIVVMVADPLVATIEVDNLDTSAAIAQGRALEASHAEVLSTEGISGETKVQDYTNALNGFSARLDYDDAVKLASNPKVALVLPDEMRYPTGDDGSDGSRPDDLGNYLGLTARGEAWRSGLTGEGVVVGVIDTGIWPEHPSFADDGTFPTHDALENSATSGSPCNFGNTTANADDLPFSCNNKLIGARQMLDTYRFFIGADDDEFDSARDDDGHGTHTASTAAGNANVQAAIGGRNVGVISGVAPRAQIIAYKALGNLGGFTSDLVAAIDQAVEDGVDVINYSIGGGASLVSGDTIAFLLAADAGVFAAVSAGNEGPGPETVGGPADVPWVTAVGANTMKRFFQGEVRLDHGPTLRGSSITATTGNLALVDAAQAGTSDLCLADTLDPAKVAGKIVLCRRGGNGRVEKSFEVFNAGGAGMILYNASNDDNLFTDNHWVPSVHVDLTQGLQVKAYLETARRPMARIANTAKITSWDSAPSMTIFSSRGPNLTAADIIKPDITAPGIQILAGNTPFPDPGVVPDELFQAIAGTSMSSPVMAGVYALIKQAHPTWTPAMAKSAVMTTANTNVKDNDRVSQAGPFAMGAGEVDPGKVNDRNSVFNPGLVYDAGLVDYLGFLCDAQRSALEPGADEFCAELDGAGIAIDASDLNYPSIGVAELAGSQTVTRTVTSVATSRVTFRASVQAPAGFSVVVVPDRITLNPGESATYQVTITNSGSAPLGEWRTGSLTWKGSGYSARSPLAVRAAQLNVPAEITFAGGAGSGSFDVKFGYTGAYSAQAHGLVASVPLTGSVIQDADETFPSDDDANGGVALFPVDLAGAVFARFELSMPDIPDDLDMYLLDPAGEIVAASFNGGTDETIDFTPPAAGGVYTLAVHGWAVTVPTRDFTVDSWVVPAAGSTLAIDSAPASAVNGQVGTIAVSWSGVAAGTRSMGLISHHDATGAVAVTLVAVDG
jgi:subtilisin family serine protease